METVKLTCEQEWYDDGQIAVERYRLNDILHNENGPAVRIWYKIWYSGDASPGHHLYYEGYRVKGVRHRLDGPAERTWDADGKLTSEMYWIEGAQLTKKEFHARTASCNNKIVEVDGKKYKLVAT